MLPNCKVPVFAIDPGRSFGWATYHEGMRRSGSETIQTAKGEPIAMRWALLREMVEAELRLVEVRGVLAYEKPVITGGKLSNERLLALVGMEVTLLSLAHQLGWQTMSLGPSSLKNVTTGNGRAEKDEMIRWAESHFPSLSMDEHQADAIALREWAVGKLAGLPSRAPVR